MTNPATIFQRTHTGREEIHNKSHGLTQSERLVLIMVDGVSSYKEIRAKLPVLTDERFDRALLKLQTKELVLEVFMPMDGQAPDELERTVIDRFLQQDPMDPVTVILQDPEDELGLLSHAKQPTSWADSPLSEATRADLRSPVSEVAAKPSATTVLDDAPLLTTPIPPSSSPMSQEATLDAEDVQAADDLMAELKAKREQKPAPSFVQPAPARLPDPVVYQAEEELNPLKAVHWGYWLIVSGLSFILGFFLARLTA